MFFLEMNFNFSVTCYAVEKHLLNDMCAVF